MKLLIILSCLCGLLQANIVTRHLDVVEGEATYRQTVTIDYDKNIQIVEVPAHNHIIHSKTIFDFNKGKLFESHPEKKTCSVRDIPEGTADLKTFDEYLQKKTDKLIASKEKRIEKAFKTSRKWNVKMLKSMVSEVIEECGESEIYEVVEVPLETARKPFVEVKPLKEGSTYENMMKSEKCQMPTECIWQTCTIGGISCYWTIECPLGDCDIYHSSILDGTPIHCVACFNQQCPGCMNAWNDPACHETIGSDVPPCDENPDLGGDCQDPNEPYCFLPMGYDDYKEASEKGEFICPNEVLAKGIVHLKDTCIYSCNGGRGMYAGYLACAERDINGKKEGYFDETMYTPEICGV